MAPVGAARVAGQHTAHLQPAKATHLAWHGRESLETIRQAKRADADDGSDEGIRLDRHEFRQALRIVSKISLVMTG